MEKKKNTNNVPTQKMKLYQLTWRNICGSQSCRTPARHLHFKDRKLERGDRKWFIPVIQAGRGKNPRSLFQSTLSYKQLLGKREGKHIHIDSSLDSKEQAV